MKVMDRFLKRETRILRFQVGECSLMFDFYNKIVQILNWKFKIFNSLSVNSCRTLHVSSCMSLTL